MEIINYWTMPMVFAVKFSLKRILAKINVFRSSILSCRTRFGEFINDHCTRRVIQSYVYILKGDDFIFWYILFYLGLEREHCCSYEYVYVIYRLFTIPYSYYYYQCLCRRFQNGDDIFKTPRNIEN